MDDYEHIDWDAFIILAEDPEIDVATAFAASVADEDEAVDAQSSVDSDGGTRLVVLIVLLIVIATFLLAV